MKPELKKLLVLNLPYLLFVYLFAKCGQAYRLAAGADASAKLLNLTGGISAAFASSLPSLHPFDLCVGIAGAVTVRLIVYSKGKNAKKYRKGKQLVPTKDGINLAVVLPESLTSPVLTAEWENRLTEIAKGNADADEFMAEIEAQVRQLVKTYLATGTAL